MPFFKSVGHIDDTLTPAEVKKEYRRRYSLNKYYLRRTELLTQLGGKCSECGSTDDLTFVRKEGAPPFKVGQLTGMSKKTLEKVIDHVTLMCGEHAKKTLYGMGEVTHGTWYSTYKKKCRCDECEEFMADYRLRRREDRRFAKEAN